MVDSISKPLQSPQIGDVRSVNRAYTDRQPAAETQVREKKDRLEISSQAEALQNAERTPRLQEVQSQIYSGYYNQPDVIRMTAGKMVERLFSSNSGK